GDQLFLRRPITRSHSTIIFNGGPTSRARTGVTPSGPIATSREKKNIPSSKSRTRTLRHMPNGPGNVCRPKRHSNLRRAEVCLEKHTSGETNSGLTGNGWPTPGRENFRVKTRGRAVLPESHRSKVFRQTVMVSTTWLATSGNGAAIG